MTKPPRVLHHRQFHLLGGSGVPGFVSSVVLSALYASYRVYLSFYDTDPLCQNTAVLPHRARSEGFTCSCACWSSALTLPDSSIGEFAITVLSLSPRPIISACSSSERTLSIRKPASMASLRVRPCSLRACSTASARATPSDLAVAKRSACCCSCAFLRASIAARASRALPSASRS